MLQNGSCGYIRDMSGRFAKFIKNKPILKSIKKAMNMVTEKEKKIGIKNDKLYSSQS